MRKSAFLKSKTNIEKQLPYASTDLQVQRDGKETLPISAFSKESAPSGIGNKYKIILYNCQAKRCIFLSNNVYCKG